MGKGDLGCYNGNTKHSTNVCAARMVRTAPYTLPYARGKDLDEKIDQLLDDERIIPSTTPWAAGVALVSKLRGRIKFAVVLLR